MSPHSVRVSAHKVNYRCVGRKAICVLVGALNANEPPSVEFCQGDDKVKTLDCPNKSRHCEKKNLIDVNACDGLPSVKDPVRPSPKDSLVVAFNHHINALLESAPPSLLKEKLVEFKEHDWRDIMKVLECGEIDSVDDIRSHWRQIESLVGDTNDVFLQEGALLLSLILGETDLASEFYASVGGMEMCILDGMRDKSLPDSVRSLLPKFKTRLLQCRIEVQKVLESEMQRDKRTEALVTQREKLFAHFKAFVEQTPESRYRELFKRQGYKCLMSVQNCQRSPLRAPELAAFSKALRAIAANTGNSDLFGKLFHVIYTTLRDANESPTPQGASLLVAQCNEILSQHGHLLSPVVLKVLEAKGEAAFKRVSQSAAERSVPISESWLSALSDPVWLSQLVDSVSGLVHTWWGINVKGEGDVKARQGPVTASKIIASVNPALAGTLDHFLKSVRAILVDVPLEAQQHVALQRLLQSEHYIVEHMNKVCRGATKSDLEVEIKQKFSSHVNSLWSSIIENLGPEISRALNEKYAETLQVVTQTSTLRSLIQRVEKFTVDRRVQALISYIFVLSNFMSGVKGATTSTKEVAVREVKVDQQLWDKFICPALTNGTNLILYDKPSHPRSGPIRLMACNPADDTKTETETAKALEIWRTLFRGSCPPLKNWIRGSIIYSTDEMLPDKVLESAGLDLTCAKSFQKKLRDFHDLFISHWCSDFLNEFLRGKAWKEVAVPVSNHSKGIFTFCGGPNIQEPYLYEYDQAQFEQLQCRRYVQPPVAQFKPSQAVIRKIQLDVPPPLVLKEAKLRFLNQGNGALILNTDSEKWMAPCPQKSDLHINPPEVTDTSTVSETRFLPSYILGPPLPDLASGDQKIIDVDGAVYGLYEKTPSGLKPAMNEARKVDTIKQSPFIEQVPITTQAPTTEQLSTTIPPTTTIPPPTTTQQPSTLGFTFPTYPPVVPSTSTAVGPMTSLGTAVGQHLWETVLGVGGVATAAAVAFYMCYKRSQTPTEILLDQYLSDEGTSYPLTNMRFVATPGSRQEIIPFRIGTATPGTATPPSIGGRRGRRLR